MKRFRIKSMWWLFLIWMTSWLVVILPLIYLLKGHGIGYLVKIWGYAPNQFIFTTLYFPMASICVLLSVHILYKEVYPLLPIHHSFRSWFLHWPATALLALAMASLISLVVYWNSLWSIDKLHPCLAELALDSMRELDEEISAVSLRDEEQENYRRRLLQEAKIKAEEILEKSDITWDDHENFIKFMQTLSSAERLQVLLNPKTQHTLRLLDPTLLAMNVFQILVQVFYAILLVSVSIILALCARILGYDGYNYPVITRSYQIIFIAATVFGTFPILYSQFRRQVEYYVGPGGTILQDVFSALLVIAFLVWLRMEIPQYRTISVYNILTKYTPIFFIGIGSGLSWIDSVFLEQLVGKNTNPGIQLLLFLFSITIFVLALFRALYLG